MVEVVVLLESAFAVADAWTLSGFNVTSENAGTYKDTDTDGIEVALGYEHDMGEFGIRAELAYHSFDDVKADNGKSSDVDANKITVSNMEGATARISLVKSF